jgi:MFS family permease
LFWCQFLASFNDNFVRNLLAMLILFELGKDNAGALITLALAIFILPSIFLSGLAGEMADSNDKAMLVRRLKLAEIFIQMIAAAGVWLWSLPLLYTALFGLGVVAALFTPLKYGLLPEHLSPDELMTGNALVEAATFLAILFGLVFGGLAAGHARTPSSVTAQLMTIALLSYATSLAIPPTKVAAPDLHARIDPLGLFVSVRDALRQATSTPFLRAAAHASSWFWLTGAVALALVPVAVRKATHAGLEVEVAVTALFAVGIAVGSLGAAIVARGRILLALCPLGALGMAAALIDLAFASTGLAADGTADIGLAHFFTTAGGLHIAGGVTALAASAGLFILPISAALQVSAPHEKRARTLAGANCLSSIYIVAGAIGTALLQGFAGLSEQVLLGLLGAANLGAAFYAHACLKAPLDAR